MLVISAQHIVLWERLVVYICCCMLVVWLRMLVRVMENIYLHGKCRYSKDDNKNKMMVDHINWVPERSSREEKQGEGSGHARLLNQEESRGDPRKQTLRNEVVFDIYFR